MPPPAGVTGTACAFNTVEPTITSGFPGWIQCDNKGQLLVNIAAGGLSGTTSNATSGVATSSTNLPTVAYNYTFNGTTWDQWRSNSAALADGFTPPTAGLGLEQAFLMLWNGATWDRAQGLTAGTAGTPSTQVVSVQGVSGGTNVPVQTSDPCSYAAKSSAAISVTSGTTTSLVAVSGSTVVYVCGISITIAPSAVTAATALFEYGTGAACTGPTTLTGTYGNGDLTSTVGVAPINYGGGGQTIFKSAASNGICILTAGNVVNVQGVITYVQQ